MNSERGGIPAWYSGSAAEFLGILLFGHNHRSMSGRLARVAAIKDNAMLMQYHISYQKTSSIVLVLWLTDILYQFCVANEELWDLLS